MELFSYSFVWVALFVSFLVSICAGVIGAMIVANKNVFVAGGVAHGAFGGVGIALYLGFSPTLGALGFGVGLALFLAYAFLYQKPRLDAYVGASWAFGMALGVVLMDLREGYGSDLSSYLFGSILAVTHTDMWLIGGFDVALLLFVWRYYYEILALFYQSELCALKGFRLGAWVGAIFVLIAIGVVLSMSVAGLVLVLALLCIPAYIAQLFSHSLKSMMFYSWLISLLFMWGGFFIAYFYNLSVGACIVLLLCLGMLLALLWHKWQNLTKSRRTL